MTPPPASRRHPRRLPRLPRHDVLTGLVVAVALGVRGVVIARSHLYWDDLILVSRASDDFSLAALFTDHDGHLMPGALAISWVTTRLAPLDWWLPATTLILLQILVAASLWRLLRVLLGRRPAVPVLLALALLSPLSLPSTVWWAAGLNVLPLQAALALVAADAVLWRRDPSRARLLRMVAFLAVALLFYEKALIIGPSALLLAAAAGLVAGTRWRRILRDLLTPTLLLGAVSIAWLVVYAVAVTNPTPGAEASQVPALALRGLVAALAPGLVGGPWSWERWIPGPPFAAAPPATWALSVVLLLLAAAATVLVARRRLRVAAVWLGLATLIVLTLIPVAYARSSEGTALEIMQTLRYLPDAPLLVTATTAVILRAPRRAGWAGRTVLSRIAAGTLATAIAAGSLVSTVTFDARWHDDPAIGYVSTLRASLAEAAGQWDVQLFEQELPLTVLLPVAYPDNELSRFTARLTERPEFGSWTARPLMVDGEGHLVDAGVIGLRHGTLLSSGSGALSPKEAARRQKAGACFRTIGTNGAGRLALDDGLIDWAWVIAIPYDASTDGLLDVSLDTGEHVTVPVTKGNNTVWVRLTGSGTGVWFQPITPGLSLCLGEVEVGQLVPTDPHVPDPTGLTRDGHEAGVQPSPEPSN